MNETVLLSLTRLYLLDSDTEKAKDLLTSYLETSTHPSVKVFREYYHLAIEFYKHDIDLTITAAKKLLECDPLAMDPFNHLAHLYNEKDALSDEDMIAIM